MNTRVHRSLLFQHRQFTIKCEIPRTSRWNEAAVVTGGSRGIGKGIAAMLAERGHRVGPVKILVNAAGVVRDAPIPLLTDEHLHEVIGTNLLGSIYMVRALAKNFLRQNSGIIVNIGSIAGLQGNAGQTAYSASKSALVGVTRTWAKELGPKGVRVNLIAPGVIATDMLASLSQEQIKKLTERSVLKRLGTVGEVVSAVRFVIENEFVTGQVINVDGGASWDIV